MTLNPARITSAKFHLIWLIGLALFLFASNLEALENKRVRIKVQGVSESRLKNQLISSTSIPPHRPDHHYWQANELRREIQEEMPRWLQVLHAYGYFDAKLHVNLKETCYCWVIELGVALGPKYQLTQFSVVLQENKGEPSLEQPLEEPPALEVPLEVFLESPLAIELPIAIQLPMPASVKLISGAEKELLNYYRNGGYAKAELISKRLEINTIDKTAKIAWVVDQGPYYLFGPTSILGLEKLRPKFVESQLLFIEGTPYNKQLVDQTQGSLESSSQFDACLIVSDFEKSADQQLPTTIALSEAKARTISFGASLMTGSGMGGRFLWENRNLTGYGDLLALRAQHSKWQKSASLVYSRPDFLPDHTDLRLQLEYNDEMLRPYADHNLQASMFFDRRLNKRLFFSYGTSLQYLETFDSVENSMRLLFELPVSLTWTNSLNPLNPLEGRSHQILLTPYFSLNQESSPFIKIALKNGFYYPLCPWLTIAYGMQIGTLVGAKADEIPVPLRFFEGGPNGFRGYAYKMVSPLNHAGDVTGGRSYLLGSLELRFHLDDDLSLVPFYEIGRVYSQERPDLNSKYLRSTGIGLNYDTIIGPIRLDVAIPLNRRQDIDPGFQIYLNVGPAF